MWKPAKFAYRCREEALTAMYDLLDPFLKLHFSCHQSGKKAVFTDLDPIEKRTVWRVSVMHDGEHYVGQGTSKKRARVAAAEAALKRMQVNGVTNAFRKLNLDMACLLRSKLYLT